MTHRRCLALIATPGLAAAFNRSQHALAVATGAAPLAGRPYACGLQSVGAGAEATMGRTYAALDGPSAR